ncbi:MAG: hypothetical protein ABIF77_18970 [bacterium]
MADFGADKVGGGTPGNRVNRPRIMCQQAKYFDDERIIASALPFQKSLAFRVGQIGSFLKEIEDLLVALLIHLILLRCELASEPSDGKSDFLLHGFLGDSQCLGSFPDAESTEESQIDNPGLPFARLLQSLEGFIEAQKVVVIALIETTIAILKTQQGYTRSTLLGVFLARVIDQDSAHRSGGHSQEMRFTLPIQLVESNQTDVRLVHESSRLEGMVNTLPPHVLHRDRVKFPGKTSE